MVLHPVSFFSKINSYQLMYTVVEEETLALVWALKNVEVYVDCGVPLLV